MKRWVPLLLMLAIICGSFLVVQSAAAKDAVVHAVLFYSPTCLHCAKLDKQIMPELQKKYGPRLVILRVNVISAAGSRMYDKVLERFKVTEERIGVPALVMGDAFLVGTIEIPEKFPGLIDAALPKGGQDWPDLPGLPELIRQQGSIHPENLSAWQLMAYKFQQDPLANGIAVMVLIIMVASLIGAVAIPLTSLRVPRVLASLPGWVIPPLAVIGLAVAVYLSYVEVSETRAVCGPVGNCNAVQNSPYAKLFGILPIAVMGMGGYLAILAVWFFQRFGPARLRSQARLALWGLAIFSVLFSSYLTFLEPFVIGATCTLCLASAMVLVMILWFSILPVKKALRKTGHSR